MKVNANSRNVYFLGGNLSGKEVSILDGADLENKGAKMLPQLNWAKALDFVVMAIRLQVS
jgi:hypothetical protein